MDQLATMLIGNFWHHACVVAIATTDIKNEGKGIQCCSLKYLSVYSFYCCLRFVSQIIPAVLKVLFKESLIVIMEEKKLTLLLILVSNKKNFLL